MTFVPICPSTEAACLGAIYRCDRVRSVRREPGERMPLFPTSAARGRARVAMWTRCWCSAGFRCLVNAPCASLAQRLPCPARPHGWRAPDLPACTQPRQCPAHAMDALLSLSSCLRMPACGSPGCSPVLAGSGTGPGAGSMLVSASTTSRQVSVSIRFAPLPTGSA